MLRTTPADYLAKPYGRVIVPEEDGSWFASIPDFPGCIASGMSIAEAALALEDVAVSWLECCIEQGQPIPGPRDLVEMLRLSPKA